MMRKSKSLITGGLLGLAGLGLLPQGAEASTDLPAAAPDPSLGEALAGHPSPVIAPAPSAQATAPQVDEAQPAWSLEDEQSVAIAAASAAASAPAPSAGADNTAVAESAIDPSTAATAAPEPTSPADAPVIEAARPSAVVTSTVVDDVADELANLPVQTAPAAAEMPAADVAIAPPAEPLQALSPQPAAAKPLLPTAELTKPVAAPEIAASPRHETAHRSAEPAIAIAPSPALTAPAHSPAPALVPAARPTAPDRATLQARSTAVQALIRDLRAAAGLDSHPATAPAALPSTAAEQGMSPAPAETVSLPPTAPTTIAQALPAADAAQIRNDLQIAPLTTTANPRRTFGPSPNAGIPSGFGANGGDLFISASLSGADRLRPEADGSISAGFGLGDSRRVVGVELNYNLLSVRRFGENGGFDAKIHRQVYSSDETEVAAAVGLNNFASYGREAGGSRSSLYGVVTAARLLQPEHPVNRMPITGTLGIGGGTFSGKGSDVGVIAGVGLQVHPQFSLNTAWSGVGVNVGASIVPVPTVPLTLNLLYGDIGNNTQAGSVAVLSIGYGFNFGPRF